MIFNVGAGGASKAESIKYNNAESGLEATDVQGAVDELNESVNEVNNSVNEVNESLKWWIDNGLLPNPNNPNPIYLISYTNIEKIGETLKKSWTTQASASNVEIFRLNPKGKSIKFTVGGDMVSTYSYYYQVSGGSLTKFNSGSQITLPSTSDDVIFYINTGGNAYAQTVILSDFEYA